MVFRKPESARKSIAALACLAVPCEVEGSKEGKGSKPDRRRSTERVRSDGMKTGWDDARIGGKEQGEGGVMGFGEEWDELLANVPRDARGVPKVKMYHMKPYAIVDSLDELQGPIEGSVTLPHSVFWAPGSKTLSIDCEATRMQAYQAVLSEGTVEQVREYVNRDLLIEMWPRLNVPIRVAKGWEQRFPELQGNMRASW